MEPLNLCFYYAQEFHDPGSGGPLNLPFQRPVEACRKFTSTVVNTAIDSLASKIADLDLARLFTNTYPNTLDTTIQATKCINVTTCNPLSYVTTGDIDAMWLRDSANQLLPYIDYVNQDLSLKRLFLGLIYMQASFIKIDPYANAFNKPSSLASVKSATTGREYNAQGQTLHDQQDPTFNEKTGYPMESYYNLSQPADRPTETQFLNGIGQPVKRTGLVKSLFRPSDDASVFPFFIPGNAMISVGLEHAAQLVQRNNGANNGRLSSMATEMSKLSKEIRDAIYTHGIVDVPGYNKVFGYEVDGYGSKLIIDDANVPSLLSLSMLGFVDASDPIYQNTRRLVLSKDNPYYFSGPRAGGLSGIGRNRYTRPWFAWVNGLFGQAILKLAKERPHLLFDRRYN
ncbi:Six-hairpin glycosidase-like protein [Fennellomyces sp. T-0311]|nr:Six-hairpin glycosidase-like protein [Fennellomyces sp. T-0311]